MFLKNVGNQIKCIYLLPLPHSMEINEQQAFFYQHSNILQNILFYVKK